MAEVEIHTAHAVHDDAFGQGVGILVGIIGVLLSVVTILSHREHTAAVVHRTEANDQWAYYQAKKIREYSAQVSAGIVTALALDPTKLDSNKADSGKTASKTDAVTGKFTQDSERYAKDAEGIQALARQRDAESKHAEDRAARFDLGEGFLELGLVMSSLYFLSRKRFFVALGAIAAVSGSVIGVIGFLA